EGDEAANRRWILTLGIGEAGADIDARAIVECHLQRTEAALVPASARRVTHNAPLGVEKTLYLQQRHRTADGVLRARLAQHQPLAAQRLDARQFLAQMIG